MWPNLLSLLASPLLIAQAVVPAPAWDALPAEVSGAARGVVAAAVDPAAAGTNRGVELQLRHVGSPALPGTGALGLYGTGRLGPLGLMGGYAWSNLPNPRGGRGLMGFSMPLGPRLRLGVNLARLHPLRSSISHSVVDMGLLFQPHPALAISLGGDALNAPGWPRRAHMRRALRLGIAVRPFSGDIYLTLGADARMSYAGRAYYPDSRAYVDVMPYEGLHLLAAYRRAEGAHTAWAGLALDVGGLELMGAGRAHDSVATRARDRMAWALTYRSRPTAPLPVRRHEHLHVAVAGDLRSGGGLWSRGEAVATLPARLALLADDPDVAQVTLDIGALDVGYAAVDELRRSIGALRAANIRVTAHLVGADTRAYWVASAANHITMDPLGTLDVRGFRIRSTFYGSALANLGIRFDAVGVGRFKSAPDKLTQDGPRPEDVQVQQGFVADRYARLLQALTHGRNLSEAAAHAALAYGPMDAQTARRLGLIDAVEPGPDRSAWAPRPAPTTSLSARAASVGDAHWGPVPRISIVPLVGAMVQQAGDAPWMGDSASCAAVVDALAAADANPDVIGVVLRIDSPGGDVVAAENVYRAVRSLARHKPVAVSMGDVAASGGYYAAMGAHRIFASPQTLTGSIGIYSVKPDISGLLAAWHIRPHHESLGERAGWDDLNAPLSEADSLRLEHHLQALYGLFVDRVAEGRSLTRARVEELGQGRVYTGAQAHQMGLVDEMGGLSEAVAWVRVQAKQAPDAHVVWSVPRRAGSWPLWAAPMMGLNTAAAAGALAPASQAAILFGGASGQDPRLWTQMLRRVSQRAWAIAPWLADDD